MCRDAVCGDSLVHTGVEDCDDGNTDDTDACLTTCTAASCGDGFVQTGVEDCDDGNAMGGDGCNDACAHEYDAGPMGADAGTDAGPMGADGGTVMSPPTDGGCGCRVQGRDRAPLGMALLFLAGAMVLRRRRRRK